MTELATLARPYAEAVFERAKEAGKTEQWSSMLAFLAAVVRDREMAAIIDNPKVSDEDLIRLLLDICGEQIDVEGANLIKLLVVNGRLTIVSYIARLYEEYRAEDEGYVDVTIASAFSMTKAEQKKLEAALEKRLDKKVHMNLEVDESLIGGVLVRAGDTVIDGSIRGQLQQLAKIL